MEFKCDKCDLKYKNKGGLSRHHAAKHQNLMRRYFCAQCDADYTNTSSLLVHVQDKHEGKTLKCQSCDFQTGVFNFQQKIAAHRRLKHGEQKLKCSMCEFETYHTSTLWSHKKIVHEEKRFFCNQCDYCGRFQNLLNQHITKMHNTGEDLVECDMCAF